VRDSNGEAPAKLFRTGMWLDSGFYLGARVFLIFIAPSGNGRNDLDPWAFWLSRHWAG
jgi:hypothetical protein